MKNTTIPLLCIVTLSFMISGCVSKWEHPIKGENDFAIDKCNCSIEASTLYPPLFYASPFQAGSNYPYISHNTPFVYGFSRRGFYLPPPYNWQDYNESDRKKAFNECMKKLGWEWSFE